MEAVVLGLSSLRKNPELPIITVNLDIFVCTNFRRFTKIGNFACIRIRVLSITCSFLVL